MIEKRLESGKEAILNQFEYFPQGFVYYLESLYCNLSPKQKADTIYDIGIEIAKFCYFKQAIACWEYALSYSKQNKDLDMEAGCYGNIGNALNSLGYTLKSIDFTNKAVNMAKQTGNLFLEANSYSGMGSCYKKLGQYQKSIEYHNKALDLSKRNNDIEVESNCYLNLANAYKEFGDYQKAIEYYDKGINLSKRKNYFELESSCYLGLSCVYEYIGELQKAIEFNNKALDLALKRGNRKIESSCYVSLGVIYKNREEYQNAIDYHNKALDIAIQVGDIYTESYCYGNLANVYEKFGDYQKALEYHNEALKMALKNHDSKLESNCYGNLAITYYELKDYIKAIEYDNKSVEIKKRIGDKQGESICYRSLGNSYFQIADYQKSIEYNNKALDIAVQIGNVLGQAGAYANLGNLYTQIEEFQKSLEYHYKSLNLSKQVGSILEESLGYINIGYTYYALKNYQKSYENLAKAFEYLEKLGESIIQEDHKIGHKEKFAHSKNLIIPVCSKLGKKEEMFEYIERCKSKAFLDILSTTKIKPPEILNKQYNHLIQQEEDYNIVLNQAQIGHINQPNIQIKLAELNEIITKREELYERIENINSECKNYVSLRRGRTLKLNQAQELIKNQKKKTILIEYFLFDCKIYIFLIEADTFHIEEVPMDVEEFNLLLRLYSREVVNYSNDTDQMQNWLQIGKYLIEPIQKYLQGKELIYFVPYEVLHYLPLHSLHINNEPIIKKFDVCYAPSSSIISYCKTKGTNKYDDVISFGTAAKDDLRFMKELFEQEATDVAKIFEGQSYNGNDATKAHVLKNVENNDIIHFSCHGFFDPIKPLKSGILLHNDEILTAEEIFNYSLNSELITLSACQTGLSENKQGDELIGLTRALFYGGASSVIVSLWSVHAKATSELMIEFYKNLKKGQKKSLALRNAQLTLIDSKEYSHTFYWAPFILVGDWE